MSMFTGPLRVAVPAVSAHPSTNPAPAVDSGRGKVRSFVEVLTEGQRLDKTGLHAGSAPSAAASPGGTGRAVSGAGGEDGPTMRALAVRALEAEKHVEALIADAGKGRTFSAAELIALQAAVFRYSQTVEVISRTTDRLVGAIKQTLGTQV